jgi:hypothetical protein
MLSNKVEYIRQNIRDAGSDVDRIRELSSQLCEELVENCEPTRDEFVELMDGIELSPDLLWDLVLNIPRWDSAHRSNGLPFISPF